MLAATTTPKLGRARPPVPFAHLESFSYRSSGLPATRAGSPFPSQLRRHSRTGSRRTKAVVEILCSRLYCDCLFPEGPPNSETLIEGIHTGQRPYRDELLSLLRLADCHYGAALRDEEAGLSVEEAASKREEVKLDRIVKLRKAVHMVATGEHSNKRRRPAMRTVCSARCCTSRERCPPSCRGTYWTAWQCCNLNSG